jgi:hypothetical protein
VVFLGPKKYIQIDPFLRLIRFSVQYVRLKAERRRKQKETQFRDSNVRVMCCDHQTPLENFGRKKDRADWMDFDDYLKRGYVLPSCLDV